ncbi:hypothetical protein [Ralstonia pseudosolanacearum]|uniref:hypothetical protein n=1 Tax=Ralstonia pseudosolanacearum TaxID=1310165 RepID=UPI0023DC6F27|nr:hypothetical protein [Ralstonia pseudosolanacearum]
MLTPATFSLEAQPKRNPAAQGRFLANRFIPIPKFVLLSNTGNWPSRWSNNQPGVCPLQPIKRIRRFI